jgi:hypothetical protein
MLKDAVKGALIASAVAGLFSCASSNANSEGMAKSKEGVKAVMCAGVNECKGHGACGGADNSCKGQNACKGQGVVETASEKDCTDKGGKVVAAK